jgi:CRP/FNR family transcriptional regulator, cyclic AMP receptor protein
VCDMVHKDVFSRLASAIMRLVEDEGIVTREGFKIPTHYTHDHLGTMIGANRVAVTKAFSTLQNLGVVEQKRRLIHVPDVEALRFLASEERELARNSESTDEGDSRQRSSG